MEIQTRLFRISDEDFCLLLTSGKMKVSKTMFGSIVVYVINVSAGEVELDFCVCERFLVKNSTKASDIDYVPRSVNTYSNTGLKNRLLFCARYLVDPDQSIDNDYAFELHQCILVALSRNN